MQAGLLQRDCDETAGCLQRIYSALRCAKIAAKQNQNRRVPFDRLFCFALETAVGAGRVSMEICGRMRQRRFARAIGKFLRLIAPAGIENSQAKVGLVFWLHVIRRASTPAEAWAAESILREFDRSDGRAPLGEFPSALV